MVAQRPWDLGRPHSNNPNIRISQHICLAPGVTARNPESTNTITCALLPHTPLNSATVVASGAPPCLHRCVHYLVRRRPGALASRSDLHGYGQAHLRPHQRPAPQIAPLSIFNSIQRVERERWHSCGGVHLQFRSNPAVSARVTKLDGPWAHLNGISENSRESHFNFQEKLCRTWIRHRMTKNSNTVEITELGRWACVRWESAWTNAKEHTRPVHVTSCVGFLRST